MVYISINCITQCCLSWYPFRDEYICPRLKFQLYQNYTIFVLLLHYIYFYTFSNLSIFLVFFRITSRSRIQLSVM